MTRIANVKTKSRVRDVSAIGLIWLLARLPLVLYHYPPQVQVDSFCYQPFWQQLTDWEAHNPVLYGTFLSLFPPMLVIPMQHLMVLLSSLCVYEIARQTTSRWAGLIGALFIVIYGDFVLYAHTFMSEILFNLFVALHLLILWFAISRRSMPGYFLCGLSIGIAANVRPIIQYQGIILAVTLLPFHIMPIRKLKLYALFMTALFCGFLLIYLPTATLTRMIYGEFTLSSGLSKVMMYRLVWDEGAPLANVSLDDPQLIRIRDYLAQVGKSDEVIWSKAYDHIREEILDIRLPEDFEEIVRFYLGVSSWANRMVDSYIKKLWWRYVKTYPTEYIRFSMSELSWVFKSHSSFSGSEAHSIEMLPQYPMSRFEAVRTMPLPSKETLAALDGIYYKTAPLLTSPTLIIVVLFLGTIHVVFVRRHIQMFLVCLYSTMAYLLIPQFVVGIGLIRYRYPFDLVYALVLGMVLAQFWPYRKL